MRARQHVQAPVLERRLGHGQPHTDDGSRGLEREVEAVLVPRLAPRAGVLEDELGQEARDLLGAEQARARATARRAGRRTRGTPGRARGGRPWRRDPRSDDRRSRPGSPA